MAGVITRRHALRTLGGAGLGMAGAAILTACGSSAGQSVAVATTGQIPTTTAGREQAATATATTTTAPAGTASSAATTVASTAPTVTTSTAPVPTSVASPAGKAGTLDWIVWGSADQTKAFKGILDAFAKGTPDFKVQLEVVPFGQFFDKLQTEIAGAAAPDVAMASPIWVPNYVAEKIYQPLDSFMARDHFDSASYFPAALQAFAVDGKQYGLPHLLNPSITFYNKDLFGQAGVKPPDPSWTWDTYLQAAQTLTRQTGGKTTQFGTNQVGTLNPLLPFIWMNGGDIFDNDEHPTRSTASNPATIEAIQWMADLLTKYHAAPGPGDLSGQSNPFGTGALAMQLGGAASIPDLAQSAMHVSWDVAHIPSGKDGLIDFLGGTCHGVVGTSAHAEAAWQVVRYICGPEGVKQLLTNQWGVPAIKQLATVDYVKLGPPPASRSLVVDTIDHARPLPNVTQMLQLYTPVYGKWLGDAVAGKVAAKDACASIDQLVNAALQSK